METLPLWRSVRTSRASTHATSCFRDAGRSRHGGFRHHVSDGMWNAMDKNERLSNRIFPTLLRGVCQLEVWGGAVNTDDGKYKPPSTLRFALKPVKLTHNSTWLSTRRLHHFPCCRSSGQNRIIAIIAWNNTKSCVWQRQKRHLSLLLFNSKVCPARRDSHTRYPRRGGRMFVGWFTRARERNNNNNNKRVAGARTVQSQQAPLSHGAPAPGGRCWERGGSSEVNNLGRKKKKKRRSSTVQLAGGSCSWSDGELQVEMSHPSVGSLEIKGEWCRVLVP